MVFGLLSHDFNATGGSESSDKWLVLALMLYGIPLAAQVIPLTWVRVYGIYVGLFVLLQAVISPYIAPDTYIVRKPHLNRVSDVQGNNLYGISGPQRLTSDARGYRTTKPIDYDDDSSYRIFFIGDSTVAQDWIDDHTTFAHLLQESLSDSLDRDVETVNTAVPGLRVVHFLSTMERVADLNPDMYVIVPGGNDWGLHIASHYDQGTPDQFAHALTHTDPNVYRIKYLDFFRNYTLQHSLLGRAVYPLWTVVKNFGAGPVKASSAEPDTIVQDGSWYALHRGSLFRADQRTFMPKEVLPSYADALRQIALFCQKSAARCVFATHPHSYKPGISREYMERFWMTPAFEDYTLTLESMAHVANLYNRFTFEVGEKTGVPVCDFEGQVEPVLEHFYDESHFNLKGSRKAAAVLHPCLHDAILSQRASVD
jgi:hypothetical protein